MASTSRRIATAVARSGNRKIGDAAATYAAQVSCPEECPFYNGGGCYAESGALGSFVTSPLNEAATVLAAGLVDVAEAEATAIDALDPGVGRPLRLHGVGDCKTDEAARIVSAAAERYMERGGGPVWTYTHAWRTVEREAWGQVSVLASCETPLDVALAKARGYAPSIVVDEFPSDKLYTSYTQRAERQGRVAPGDARSAKGLGAAGYLTQPPAPGLAILPCPAQTHDDVTCASCCLCFDDKAILERGYAIGFAVHGTALAVKKARQALSDPDNPTRKLTSRDFIVKHIAEHGTWPTPRRVMDGADVCHSSATQMLARMRAERKKEAVVG